MISFKEFQNLDLRVAKVLEVQDHPNANKLFVLKVDIGGEVKQCVAGLKGYYTAEQLLGKNLVMVCNLEPAKLRGVESQAMLLAAQDGENVVLVTTERDVRPGSKVL